MKYSLANVANVAIIPFNSLACRIAPTLPTGSVGVSHYGECGIPPLHSSPHRIRPMLRALGDAMMRLSETVSYCDDAHETFARAGDIRELLRQAHWLFDWQPIETAPKDGSTFFVHTADRDSYDLAEYSEKHGEFIKHGCGWDYATHWAPMFKHEAQAA